jgi:hypothetical protein
VDRVRSSRRLYVDTDSASTYAFVRARVDNILKSVSVFRRIRAAIDCLRLLADKYSSGWNMPTFGLDDADPDGDRFFGCTGDSDTALLSLLRWRKMCFSSAHRWRVATLSRFFFSLMVSLPRQRSRSAPAYEGMVFDMALSICERRGYYRLSQILTRSEG